MNNNEVFDIKNKVVVITGGTRGIGLALAKGFIRYGAKVWIHGSKEESVKKVAESLGCKYGWGDLSKQAGIDDIVHRIYEEEKWVDVVINNAGYEEHESIADSNEVFLDKTYQINTKSPYFLIQKLLPLLKKSKAASIINVTSIHDIIPVRKNASYCMSKASLAMYTKVAALELGEYGIRVNNLAPGAIATDHNRQLVKEKNFNEWIPLGRVGEAEEILGPAMFLASTLSSYVTGTTLYVDGGYMQNLLRY